jgi:hypothetical protein
MRIKYSKPKEKNPMYGKHHSKETIEKISSKKKGQRKGIPTWNKGKSIKNYSIGYENRFLNLKNKGNLDTTKLFIFISPLKETFKVDKGFERFCKEKNLDVYSARNFINKGIIPYPQKGTPKEWRKNLVGWEIKQQ